MDVNKSLAKRIMRAIVAVMLACGLTAFANAASKRVFASYSDEKIASAVNVERLPRDTKPRYDEQISNTTMVTYESEPVPINELAVSNGTKQHISSINPAKDERKDIEHSYTGNLQVGVDIPAGTYKLFGNPKSSIHDFGSFIINEHPNRLNGTNRGGLEFVGTAYAELVEGTYIHLINGTKAVPLEEIVSNPRGSFGPKGWYRVGTDIKAGTYRIKTSPNWPRGSYKVYASLKYPYDIRIYDSRYDKQSPVSLNLSDGEYVWVNGISGLLV